MKTIAFFLFVLITLGYASTPAGVIEQVYSKAGLNDHYEFIFKHSESTFGDHDMGTASDVYGWWIFGTGMTIKNTYLDEYDLGQITKINYADSEYDFEHSKIHGVLKYRWQYRWFIIPFWHSAECEFDVDTHHIKQKYSMKDEKFVVERSIEYTSGPPTLTCQDGDAKQNSHWGFDWMTQVRKDYEAKLGEHLEEAIGSWLNNVDSIFNTVTLAQVDDLSYTLKPHLKEAQPDPNANLIMGYNYDISINSKSRSPVPHEDISSYDATEDMATYFFEEYFQSLLDLDKEAVDFWLAVTQKNLPSSLSFSMKATDFYYIIQGMETYSPDTDMEVDCLYSDGNSTFAIDQAVTISLPVKCTLKAGRDQILTSTFDFITKGNAQISKQGSLSLSGLAYSVQNFNATSKFGRKVLTDYLIRRIESYAAAANPMGDIEYYDQRFNNMTNLDVTAGPQYLKVQGDFAE